MTTTDLRVPAEPSGQADQPFQGGQFVVIGAYADGSGMSGWAYGPFSARTADSVVKVLNDGCWHGMHWSVLPLRRLPGQGL
jgi:hypothetical protein